MSDQDKNIFQSQTTETQTTPVNSANSGGVQNNDMFADLLNGVKNERGEPKYRDVTEALKGLQHAQTYIPELKQENATLRNQLNELRAQVDKLKAVEDTVQKLTIAQQEPAVTKANVLDEQSVAELINRTLTQKETQAIQKANLSKVTSTLINKFGDKAEKEFYGKASELGMTVEQINALAAQSPQAVFKMLGIDSVPQQQKTTLPTSTSANTDGFTPQLNTFIGKNEKGFGVGATTQDYLTEAQNSKKLVEELHSKGMSIHDLTNPKVYFNTFK